MRVYGSTIIVNIEYSQNIYCNCHISRKVIYLLVFYNNMQFECKIILGIINLSDISKNSLENDTYYIVKS